MKTLIDVLAVLGCVFILQLLGTVTFILWAFWATAPCREPHPAMPARRSRLNAWWTARQIARRAPNGPVTNPAAHLPVTHPDRTTHLTGDEAAAWQAITDPEHRRNQ